MRACRPLLGTYVEIRIDEIDPDLALSALEAGFAAIRKVQGLMSAFDPASDISLINRSAHIHPVAVAPWTRDILMLALDLHKASDGIFDCGVGAQLAEWGLVPQETLDDAGTSTIAHLDISAECIVRSRAPVRLDLGGIAKGYAVDCAVEALRAAGSRSGAVNAGGDLRVFGKTEESIYLRNPRDPEHLHFAGHLLNGACATSATYYSRHRLDRQEISALVDPRTRQALVTRRSYSVIAPQCAIADAMTKILAVSGDPGLSCFSRYQAHPVIL